MANQDIKKRLEQEKRMEERKTREYSHQTNNSSRDYSSYLKNDNKSREQHRFKPSPVISPVYGILDKNYKKEDILKYFNIFSSHSLFHFEKIELS